MFLDYGAGSGVLGMAACLLNDQIQSVGIEIDADAIRIADVNAETNKVNMKSYLPRNLGSDDESASLIMKAIKRSSVETQPEDLDGPIFDACAANILAGPLISLAETISKIIRPGGYLGLR
jgi:ribosomal protein L11 methyltransferase